MIQRFAGNKDIVFCGVFDGHGPAGHKIARHVRDNLPSKLSSAIKQSRVNGSLRGDVDVAAGIKRNYEDNSNSTKYGQSPFFRSWKASLIKAFDAVDEELSMESAMDSYCSGTTAVNIIKQVLLDPYSQRFNRFKSFVISSYIYYFSMIRESTW